MSVERDVPLFVSPSSPYQGGAPAIVQFALDPYTLCFTSVAGRAKELLGYVTEDWLKPGFWTERIHPDERQDVTSFCTEQARAATGHEIEYRMIDRAGEEIWVHQICEPASGGGDVLPGYLMNITQRVIQQADITRVMSLRDALLQVITTELSQPINTISGYGKLLERHLSSQGDDVGSDYALGMREGIQMLNRSIARLRTAAQSEKMSFEDMISELSLPEVAEPVTATDVQIAGFAEASAVNPPVPQGTRSTFD